MLDLWLIVTLIAWMPNFLVAALASSVKFSLGWYAARGFALIVSSTLLCVLLTEMTLLYSRLASAITLQRRESTNRQMSVDAVTAAIAQAAAGGDRPECLRSFKSGSFQSTRYRGPQGDQASGVIEGCLSCEPTWVRMRDNRRFESEERYRLFLHQSNPRYLIQSFA